MNAKNRLKLFDLETQGSGAFPGMPASFEEAYPSVENLRVDVDARMAFWGEHAQQSTFAEDNFRSIVNCSNPKCYGGGLDLDKLLRFSVVEKRRTEFSETLSCSGFEGSPKGARRTGSCSMRFNVTVAVSYKQPAAPQRNPL